MAIKNKDGSVYKLTSPNPVRKEQKQWTEAPMVFHNFDWQGLTLPDEAAPATPFSSDLKNLNISAPVIEPPKVEEDKYIEEIKKEISVVIEETIEEPVEVIEESSYSLETQKFLNEQKVTMWCSPPVITEHIDHLYGENQRTIEYTSKFSFEGVIISQSDLEMKFWAPVKLTRNSIIFPRDVKTRKSRWWKIIEIEEKDGTLASCIMSEHSFNFSD